MARSLEAAVERIKKLSVERQQYAIDILEQIADAGDAIVPLSDEERRLVREGLDELDSGQAATETEVRAVFDKYRV